MLIPVFCDREPEKGMNPHEAQLAFAEHLLLSTKREFCVTMVLSGTTMRLWCHTRTSSIPSMTLAFDQESDLPSVYRALWRIATSRREILGA